MTNDGLVRLDPIDVMYVRDVGSPGADAFAELEAAVGLRGRRFYGVFDPRSGRYRACVRRHQNDDPASLGLRSATIAGGLYAIERLRGDYEELIAMIAPTFEAMVARHGGDPARPAIEFYRRHDEIVLYLPVSES
ncbi:MAG: GyrI-like domain-containing protein [Chloroflexi bacterium]|nr:GyrI-like domain-containing protein [Chloroflexota bacterium]